MSIRLTPEETGVLMLIFKIGYDAYSCAKTDDAVFAALSRAPTPMLDRVVAKVDAAGQQAMEIDNGC